ncbi:MAG: transposase [Eubacteriaceae bacterium]|nr:transposase [Eubacteriaceae bacterium]
MPNELIPCDVCGNGIYEDDLIEVEHGTVHVCRDCYDAYARPCSVCGEMYLRTNMHSLRVEYDGYSYVCPECAEGDSVAYCDGCDNFVRSDDYSWDECIWCVDFETEGKLSELTAEERLDKRKELIGPILEAYWSWVVESIGKTMPKTKAAKALAYSLNNKDGLMKFMEDGQIPLSNNIAENSIRPIVIGRKNFLFCGSPAGATATAAIYSIVESAKANGLDPRKYVVRLLEEMPKIGYDKCKKEVDRLMPWAAEIQSTCR